MVFKIFRILISNRSCVASTGTAIIHNYYNTSIDLDFAAKADDDDDDETYMKINKGLDFFSPTSEAMLIVCAL